MGWSALLIVNEVETRELWQPRANSNLQPNDYQPPALSIEHSGAVS
jgi:hypothetical protein